MTHALVQEMVRQGLLKVRPLENGFWFDRVDTVYYEPPPKPEHVCDWRFYRRRDDGLAEVLCVADGHDVNNRFRIAPKIVGNHLLPKYEGQFDV
jgi:hypothetical protein